MKILVVCQYYYPEQFRINDICETLVSLGHNVTVLTGLPNYPQGEIYPEYRWYRWFKKRNEVISGVKVIRVPLFGRGQSYVKLSLNYLSFTISSIVKTFLMKKDFDLVFVYQLSPVTMAIPAILFKKLTGKKILLYCLDIWPESIAASGINNTSFIYNCLLTLSRKIYQNIDRLTVTSDSFINYFESVIGIENGKIRYLPQYAEELYSNNIDQSLKMEEKGYINLLFAGNIGEMQSVETIIRAAYELKEMKNIRWHIVGHGSARQKCQDLATNLGLNSKVCFYGQRPISEMPRFYSEASALLVTLKNNKFISYTLPGKVQSYMAAGKPIIGAINGETRRVIESSSCGLCCEAEDYEGLARIVKQFASEPQKYSVYQKKSYDYYYRNFRKDIFIKRLLDEFNELAKG